MGKPYKNDNFEEEIAAGDKSFIGRLKCLWAHDYVKHSHAVLSRNSVYYAEVCKRCGKNNITWFGRAHQRRKWY